MTRITIDWLRDHDACWIDDPTPEQAAILAEIPDDGIPLIDVLRDDRIPGEDRIWVATRPGALPDSLIHRWLGIVVRRALGRVASPDAKSLAVLPYLDRGEPVPPDVRRDARSAAADAADYAAAYASATAAAAAYDAAADAAGAAAAAAAASATSAAANYAASDADAERDQQIADLIRIMGGER